MEEVEEVQNDGLEDGVKCDDKRIGELLAKQTKLQH
jgi:hypothetical protein